MSRPILARKDTRADEDRQRREVRSRDKACGFERRSAKGVWSICGSKSASDTAHLIRRPFLSPDSKFHVDLAMLACRDCHEAFDAYQDDVRVPIERARKAWATACALSKVPPPARYNPDAEKSA